MTNAEKTITEALVKVLNNKTIIGKLIPSNNFTEKNLRTDLAKKY